MPSKVRPFASLAAGAAMLLASGLLHPGSARAVTLDVNSTPIVFPNGAGNPKIGENAPVGFSHRYSNVASVGGVSIDAIVSVLSVAGVDSDDVFANGADNILDDLDDNGNSDPPNAINVRLDVFGPDSGSSTAYNGEAVIRVAFLQSGTQNAATLQNVVINVKDIDGNQFAEFAAISSYTLTNNTELSVATNSTDPNLVPAGSTRFREPIGNNSDPADQENWVEVKFAQLSFIDIKLGARESGSAYFGLEFAAASWTAARSVVSVAAPTYTLTYDNNGSTNPPPAASTGSGALTIAAAPSRPGFTFAGWNTLANGTGITIAAGSSFTPSANITLFAQWTAVATTTTVAGEILPATGSDDSALWLAMMGLLLVGTGWASRAARRTTG